MEQVFRIEIPVEAIDKTDTAALQRLEKTLQKVFESMKENKTAAEDAFDAIESAASGATGKLERIASANEQVAESYESIGDKADEAGDEQKSSATAAQDAADKLEDAVGDVAEAYDDTASSAADAGRKSGSAFSSATGNVDKFTQRIEKSNRTLRDMFKEKLKLTLAAIDKASPILKEVAGTVKGLTAKAWHVAVRMKDLYNLISSPITMALSIVGVGFSASEVLTTFNDFESGMSAVQALTSATDSEFLILKQTAKDLGASTSFSASEAAEGMQYLAMAGWETSQIVEAMPGLLNLAAAGATDLGTAADIVSDVMTAMGMGASEAGRAADVFAATATRSNTTIEGLGNTLKYAAPIAYSFGMSLEDVAAAAALMGNAGIKGEMAGTALRASLLRMSSPTTEMTKAMKTLGISFSDSSGKMKNMSSIIRMLESSFSGLSESEKLSYAQDLFGTEAASAWLGIINQGADAYDEMANSLYNCAGAAEQMANTRLDNLAGDMQLLSSAAESAKLNLMDKLNPYLRQAVQWFTGEIPVIQQKLGELIDFGVAKAKDFKDFISGVFNSSDFQNADGFAEKFFVAWDKIIAEPFEDWWNGGGKTTMLTKISEFGEGAGELLNGIITGIFAGIKGEEIDFEGLNITGIAKAGAEAAKTFVSSFMSGLNIGGIADEMPGLMKAGLFGFGAVKLGQGGLGIYKTVTGLKEAFSGVTAAAGTATPALGSFGVQAATSAVSVGKTASVLGGLKTALSAIPGWGWAAAAAIAAIGIGYAIYKNRQEEHDRQIRESGFVALDMAEQYEQSAQRVLDANDTIAEIKDIELILTGSDTNGAVIQSIKEQILDINTDPLVITVDTENLKNPIADLQTIQTLQEKIDSNTAQLKIVMSDGNVPEEEIQGYVDKLVGIQTRRAEIEVVKSGAGMSPEQIALYKETLEGIQSRKAEIEAKLKEGGLTQSEIANLSAEYESLTAKEAAINLTLAGSEMTKEELDALNTELETLDTEWDATIKMLLQNSDLTMDDIDKISSLVGETADYTVMLNFGFQAGSLTTEQIAAYNEQLANLYGNLVELSGGQITQADVEAGRNTEQRIEQVQQTLATEADTRLIETQMQVETGLAHLEESVADRQSAKAEWEAAKTNQDNLSTARANLMQLEAERANLVAQDELYYNRTKLGTMTMDDYDAWYESTFMPSMWGIQDRYETDVAPYAVDQYGFPLIRQEAPFFDYLLSDDAFSAYIESLQSAEVDATQNASTAEGNYNARNDNLVALYQAQKQLMEGRMFQGTDYATMSLEDMAAQYATLDEAGKQMFANAITGLAELNSTASYITDAEQANGITILEQAQQSVTAQANVEVVGAIQTKLTELSGTYQQLGDDEKSAFDAANIEAVNAALEALGIDKIESLSQIDTVLSQIAEIDPSGLNFDTAAASLEGLGGDASNAKTKVDAARAALEALEGTYTATIQIKQVGSTSVSGLGSVTKNATGGIYDGAFLSWVAEDGPEAIIPLGSNRRGRGIDLWLQAGEMLGVTEFAEGGILAPYTGAIENIPEEVWDNGEDGYKPRPMEAPIPSGGGGSHNIEVSVTANPTYEIDGGESADDILDKLKGKQKELAELLGEEFAEQLEDIVSNMI